MLQHNRITLLSNLIIVSIHFNLNAISLMMYDVMYRNGYKKKSIYIFEECNRQANEMFRIIINSD